MVEVPPRWAHRASLTNVGDAPEKLIREVLAMAKIFPRLNYKGKLGDS